MFYLSSHVSPMIDNASCQKTLVLIKEFGKIYISPAKTEVGNYKIAGGRSVFRSKFIMRFRKRPMKSSS